MGRFVLALAAASTVTCAAAPAAAQYYGDRPYYGYNGHERPYYGYGYEGVRGLEQRIFNVLRGLGGPPQVRERLRQEAINLDRELRFAGRNGLDPYEAHSFDVRIGQLERRNGYAAGGQYRYQGYGDNGRRWDYERRRDHERNREYERDDD